MAVDGWNSWKKIIDWTNGILPSSESFSFFNFYVTV